MSTRCNIKIVTVDAEGHTDTEHPLWLYHHSDGYPNGVGRELIAMLPGNYRNGVHVANRLMDGVEPMYGEDGGNHFELTDGLHGDIEYYYEIYAGDFKEVTIKAFEVVREWKGDEYLFKYMKPLDLGEYRGAWEK